MYISIIGVQNVPERVFANWEGALGEWETESGGWGNLLTTYSSVQMLLCKVYDLLKAK